MKKYPGHKQAYRNEIEASMSTFKNFPSNTAKPSMILRLSFCWGKGGKKKVFYFNQVKRMGFCYHILNYKTTEIGLMIVSFLRITTQRFTLGQRTQIHFSALLQTLQEF